MIYYTIMTLTILLTALRCFLLKIVLYIIEVITILVHKLTLIRLQLQQPSSVRSSNSFKHYRINIESINCKLMRCNLTVCDIRTLYMIYYRIITLIVILIYYFYGTFYSKLVVVYYLK